MKNGSISLFLMLFHHAELAYLNDAITEAAEELEWLFQLTAVTTSPGGVSATEWGMLGLRVRSLISQLQVGLDYYGYARNFIPHVSLETYKGYVEKLLTVAEDIETSYAGFWASTADLELQLTKLDDMIGAAKKLLRQLREEQRDVVNQANSVQQVIASLSNSVLDQQQALENANATFREAVERQTGGCSFLDVVGFVALVITVAAGAYQNIVAVVGAVGSLAQKGLALKNVIETAKVVQKDVNELRSAYNQVKPLLTGKPDAAKLVIKTDDFEEILKPYLNLPEAQELRRQMRHFVDLVTTRNQKVLDFTSLTIRYIELDATIGQQNEEIARVESQRAATRNPALVEATVLVGRMLMLAKANVVRALYQEYRAFEYWSLSQLDFSVQDQTVADLQFAHGSILDSQLRALEQRARESQLLQNVKVVLTREKAPELFDQFQRTGKMVFNLPLKVTEDSVVATSNFRPEWSIVGVKEVKIAAPGARTSDGILSISLVHCGRSVIKDSNKIIHEFTHQPRPTNISYSLIDGSLFTPTQSNLGSGGQRQFIDLSPFGTWALLILPEFNPGLNLTDVNAVTLEFAGIFQPVIDERPSPNFRRHLQNIENMIGTLA